MLASSSGASTSSRTHIGAGLVRNNPKMSATAVSACSPPDKSVSDCSFLPGGCANISSPASSGSSLSINARCAWPPLNSVAKSRRKCPSTASNAASKRALPSRFKLPMEPRRRLIASVSSSLSDAPAPCCASSSASSSAAIRFTGPMRSRSFCSRSSRADSTEASSIACSSNPSFSGSTGGGHSKRSPDIRPISTRRCS